MGKIVIPEGKKVIIHSVEGNDSKNVIKGSTPLILSEPVTISLSSSFEPFLGEKIGGKWLQQLGMISEDAFGFGFSGVFKEFGYQMWTGTDPVSLNITVTLHVDKTNVNAKEQVYAPALKLSLIPLPREGEEITVQQIIDKLNGYLGNKGEDAWEAPVFGKIDTGEMGVTNLKGPGPSIIDALQGEKSLSGRMYSIKIGEILFLKSAIIKKAEPTYSVETDSEGFPMWAQVNLDIQSVGIATQGMLKPEKSKSKSTNFLSLGR